jgi:LysR family carnitine catabolism transcriptional activator
MDVEFRHLAAFVAAARHGSFTRAAKALHVSQPAFTVQIRQLETALGVRLLDRNTRSVQLTQIGHDLAPPLERLLREFDALLLNTKSLSTKASGYVAVAALPSLSATLLPRIISSFRAANPGIAVHLRDAVGARVVSMVKAGEVDFGFGSLRTGEPDIEFTQLFKDRMSAIFRAGSPLGRKRSVALRDLISYPLILMERDSTVRTVVDRGLAAIGHYAPPAYEAEYISTALGMVKAGLGITILPASVLEMENPENLALLPIHQPDLDRDVGFIVKRGRSLSRAAESLMSSIRDTVHRRDPRRRKRAAGTR